MKITISKKSFRFSLIAAAFLFKSCSILTAMDKPLIFPIPQQLQVTSESFVLDESILIVTPKNAGEKDIALARLLVKELSNKYGIALKIQIVDAIPKGKKVVMMGTLSNPLIKKYCASGLDWKDLACGAWPWRLTWTCHFPFLNRRLAMQKAPLV